MTGTAGIPKLSKPWNWSLIVVGQMILTSALNRQESRGAHFREDSQRDDANFLKHTMAYYSPAD